MEIQPNGTPYTDKELRQMIDDNVMEPSPEIVAYLKANPEKPEPLTKEQIATGKQKYTEFIEKEVEKSEDRLTADCYQWFHNSFPKLRGLLYHVPNGGKRDQREAAKLKAMGVVPGIPDFVFHFWKRSFFIELKTPHGNPSTAQQNIHSLFNEHGFLVWVVRSLEEFQKVILAIIEDKSIYYQRGSTRQDYDYRHGVFNYLYNLTPGGVQMLSDLVSSENMDRFKGIVMEFMTDTYDKQAGFEILFTPDYKGFYKKNLIEPQNTVYNSSSTVEIPS